MSSIGSYFGFTSNEQGTWQMLGESVQGSVLNLGTGLLSFGTALGMNILTNGILNYKFNTDPKTVKDIALNMLSWTSSVLAGGFVGECVGYKAVPLMGVMGFSVDPAWIGMAGAVTAATTASWVHHLRDAEPNRKVKKT